MRIVGLVPSFQANGGSIKTAHDWMAGEDGRAKDNARAFAQDHGHAVILWSSGNVSVYARNGNGDVKRARFVASAS